MGKPIHVLPYFHCQLPVFTFNFLLYTCLHFSADLVCTYMFYVWLILKWGRLCKIRSIFQEFQWSQFKSTFRWVYGRCEGLVYKCIVSSCGMLSGVFHTRFWSILYNMIWLTIILFTWPRYRAHGGCRLWPYFSWSHIWNVLESTFP
jgi:hypothetical protein